MPTTTKWVDPEVFFTHKGVTVYRSYPDDDYDQGPCTFWYTLHRFDDEQAFDVRDLDVSSKAGLEPKIPFTSDSDPVWAAASPGERHEIKEAWDRWHRVGKREAIKRVIEEALDTGILTPEE